MNYSVLLSAAALCLLFAGAASAQTQASDRFHAEPFAGVYFDESVHYQELAAANPAETRDRRPGVITGVNLGYELGSRARLAGTVGYAEVNDFGKFGTEPGNHFVYGRNTWLTTAGGEYDVLAGRTRLSVGLQAGAAFDREERERQVGRPSAAVAEDYARVLRSGFGAVHPVVAPQLSLSHRITPGVALSAGVRDYLFVDDGRWEDRPSVTLGLRFGTR